MQRYADAILRWGLAFSFLYPPISALRDPYSWLGYFPPFAHGIVSDTLLLHVFGLIEVIVALWLISGRRVIIPATIALFMLLAIVFFNLTQIDVVFRDLSIAAMALALILLHWPRDEA